jgi:hypothetical protein
MRQRTCFCVASLSTFPGPVFVKVFCKACGDTFLLPHTIARGYPCILFDKTSSEDTPPGGLVHSPPVDTRSTRAVRASTPSSDWQELMIAETRRPVSSPDTEMWHKFCDEEMSTLSAAPEPEERKESGQPRPECCHPLLLNSSEIRASMLSSNVPP